MNENLNQMKEMLCTEPVYVFNLAEFLKMWDAFQTQTMGVYCRVCSLFSFSATAV